MSEDHGLWFVNGGVTTIKERDRVWAAHHRKWARIYRAAQKAEDRHRKLMKKFDEQFAAFKEPYTPWVGHVLEGAIPRFVNDARREWERRKQK